MIYGKLVYVGVVISFVIVGLFDMSVMPKSASYYTTILKLILPQMTFVTTLMMLFILTVMLMTDISDNKCWWQVWDVGESPMVTDIR